MLHIISHTTYFCTQYFSIYEQKYQKETPENFAWLIKSLRREWHAEFQREPDSINRYGNYLQTKRE